MINIKNIVKNEQANFQEEIMKSVKLFLRKLLINKKNENQEDFKEKILFLLEKKEIDKVIDFSLNDPKILILILENINYYFDSNDYLNMYLNTYLDLYLNFQKKINCKILDTKNDIKELEHYFLKGTSEFYEQVSFLLTEKKDSIFLLNKMNNMLSNKIIFLEKEKENKEILKLKKELETKSNILKQEIKIINFKLNKFEMKKNEKNFKLTIINFISLGIFKYFKNKKINLQINNLKSKKIKLINEINNLYSINEQHHNEYIVPSATSYENFFDTSSINEQHHNEYIVPSAPAYENSLNF